MYNLLILILLLMVIMISINKKNNDKKKKNNKNVKENLTSNVTNPFANGLSQFQLGTKIPDTSQIMIQKPKELLYHNIINNVLDGNGNIKKSDINCKKLNSYFINSKFSNNYRDVMTALHNISPNQRQLFNLQTLPVTTTIFDPAKEPPLEIMKMVVNFITQLNGEIQKLPESQEIINDYNNYLPMTSQMNKFVKNRGINAFYNEAVETDFSLYPDIPINSPVELIKILSVERQFTESETKYIVSFVIEKIIKSVTEQMKITTHFIIQNDPSQGENLFNNVVIVNPKRVVVVEYIFIDGFFSDKFNKDFECYGNDNADKKNTLCDTGNFYSFDDLNKNSMMTDHAIIQTLNKKNREHMLEMMNFNVNVPYPIYDNPITARKPSFN